VSDLAERNLSLLRTMMTTPGILYLCRALPAALLPLAVSVAGLHLLVEPNFKKPVPFYAKTIATLAVYFFSAVGSVQWKSFRHSHDARRLGAQQLPVDKGRWIGNFDRMVELVRVFHKQYPGLFCCGFSYGLSSLIKLLE
jgi:hypothetical protein